jgi:hypothetical protein
MPGREFNNLQYAPIDRLRRAVYGRNDPELVDYAAELWRREAEVPQSSTFGARKRAEVIVWSFSELLMLPLYGGVGYNLFVRLQEGKPAETAMLAAATGLAAAFSGFVNRQKRNAKYSFIPREASKNDLGNP